MIDWLSGWLRDIVMIILLATFIDLLIPNNALQRYVKVVVSLIILLTILSPVISFFKADMNIFQAAEEAAGAGSGGLPPLQQLLADGAGMKEAAERESLALVEEELAGMMRTDLARKLGLNVDSVEVRLEAAADGETPEIGKVRVRLGAGGESAGSGSSRPAGIEAVRPVEIRVPLTQAGEDGREAEEAAARAAEEAAPGAGDASERRKADGGIRRRIAAYMKETWQVEEAQITVEWSERGGDGAWENG